MAFGFHGISSGAGSRLPVAALLWLLASAPCDAAGAPGAAITGDDTGLSAERFVAALSSKAPEDAERARVYLLAISDALEFKSWCDHSKFATATLVEFVYEYVKKQPKKRLQDRAAPLIAEALQASFPCRRSK